MVRKPMTKDQLNRLAVKVLKDWTALNSFLRSCTNEAVCWELLKMEASGRSRNQFVARIYNRASKLRRLREHRELGR